MPGNYVWKPTEAQISFLQKNVASYCNDRVWEADLNPEFVELCIGVQDFRSPTESRREKIDVFPILYPDFKDPKPIKYGGGRLFRIGNFKPEATAEIAGILREHGYESMDRINVWVKESPASAQKG